MKLILTIVALLTWFAAGAVTAHTLSNLDARYAAEDRI